MQRVYQQAWAFGAKFVFAREVKPIRMDGPQKILMLSDGREITATAIVIATGAKYRRLEQQCNRNDSGEGRNDGSV
jgi:thioredoxin reductase (NADPH)